MRSQPLSLLGYATRQRSNSASYGDRPAAIAKGLAPTLSAGGGGSGGDADESTTRSSTFDDVSGPRADDQSAFLAPPIIRYHSMSSGDGSRYATRARKSARGRLDRAG